MADPTSTAPAPGTTPQAPVGATGAQAPAAAAAPATGTTPPAAAAATPQAQPATGAAPAAPAAAAPAAPAGTPAPVSKTETTQTPPAVPEKYDLKLPEKSPLAAAHLEKVATIAKEQGLSQEDAQAFLEHDHEVAASVVAAQLENLKVQQEQWKQAAVADPEIGGVKLAENAEFTKRFLDRYGTLEMKGILEQSGFGNHPEVVRLFSRVYRDLMASGQIVLPEGNPHAPAALTGAAPHYTKDQVYAAQLYGKKEGSGT